MRILWLSNAMWSQSGYGQQSALFVPRIQQLGNEMGMLAYFGLEGGVHNINGVTCFPKRFHPYGNDMVAPVYVNFRADILLSLMDTWVMNIEEYPPGMRWVPWYPIDHDTMPEIIRQKLGRATKRIAMSKHGVTATHNAGLDCLYVPHGVNTDIFKPGDKAEARTRLNWPQDKYIVLTVAMNKGNPSRKNFVEMMDAFAAFHKVHADTVYILQTDTGEGVNDTINLPELVRNKGLLVGKDVEFCNQFQNIIGYPPEYMADLYKAADVMMLVSAGEGFGIPILEAQACGCPVITSGWTANEELCFSGQLISKKDAEPFYTALAAYQYRPHVRAIELALHAEYRKPSLGAKAVERVRAEYAVDVVMENNWKPALASIQEALQ
jgi:glycosyltransferase involved in cell wall biosynthesis